MYDLHIHTTFSDGQNTPEEIVDMAKKEDVTVISITDHDSIDGIKNGKIAAEKIGISFINGIEISCSGNRELHILGYGFDYNDTELSAACANFVKFREDRAHKIINFLKEKGINIFIDEVKEIAFGSSIIGRPHFAQALVNNGYTKTVREAFDKYLGTSEFDKIERPKPSPEKGIDLITKAGGFPVLAHPALLKLDINEEEALIKRLIDNGLKGLECYYSLNSPEQTSHYISIAKKYNLLITGGSDFHGEKIKPDIKIGTGINGSLCFNDKETIDFLLRGEKRWFIG